jgi:diketogulonate reductase-like aldo/keto reductase
METTRRAVVHGLAAVALLPGVALGESDPPVTKPIPSTGEAMPVIGLGTWITFNVGRDRALLEECATVMGAFFAAGGRMIDSSPMYASSQPAIGYGLKQLGHPRALFSAEKVWISDAENGPEQMEASRGHWGVARFDLMQVHNLLSWERHLPRLLAMKAEGKLRYVGVTTSHGRRHDDLEAIMSSQPIDFIQVTYNLRDREVEDRILPLAKERGIAVIVNRPYQGGSLIEDAKSARLPGWAAEAGASNWPEFLLKFVVSHPAVTCAIPATSRVDHLRENMAAARGPMPDESMRRRMADHAGQI